MPQTPKATVPVKAQATTFAPSAVKASAAKTKAAPKAAVPEIIACPGTHLMCDGGKYVFPLVSKAPNPTHFACKGKGTFDPKLTFTITAREAEHAASVETVTGTMLADWEAWASSAGIKYRISAGTGKTFGKRN